MPILPSIPLLVLTRGEDRPVLLLPLLWAAGFQPCPCPTARKALALLLPARLCWCG